MAGKYGQNVSFTPPNRGAEAESWRPHVEHAVKELFPGIPVINVMRDPGMSKQVEDLADLYRRSMTRAGATPQPMGEQKQPFRIRRESDGKIFRYDNPVEVPKGFVQITGPVAPQSTVAPMDINTQGKGLFQRGLEAGDKFFGAAREGTRQILGTEKLGDAAWLGDALNPVPGNTAEAAATALTLPIKGNLVTGPLKRAGVAGLTGGVVRGAQGEDPLEAGARFAGGQLIGEAPGAVIGGAAKQRQLSKAQAKVDATKKLNQTITKDGTRYDSKGHEISEAARKSQHAAQVAQAESAYKAALAQVKSREDGLNRFLQQRAKILDAEDMIAHQAQKAQLTRDFQAAKQAQEQSHQAMLRAHAQQGAARIADHHKQSNPAWANLPSDETGLTDMVYGQGPKLASDRYEASFKAAMEKAKGVDIQLSPKDALALGFPVTEEFQGLPSLPFDAARVMRAITGKSQSLKGSYRRAVAALDAAGVGDPVARAEYKSSMALIDSMEKSRALEGGQYHPDRMLSGLTTTLPMVNAVRHRGEGDALRGPLADSTKGIPQEPSPLTPPTMPPAPIKRPVPRATLPKPTEPNIAPFQPSPEPQPRSPLPDPQLPEGFETKTLPLPKTLQQHPLIASGLLGAGTHLIGGVDRGTSALLSGSLLAALALGNKPFALRAPQSTLGAMGERGLFTLGGAAARGAMGDNIEEPGE
jgi:hypothetical protein